MSIKFFQFLQIGRSVSSYQNNNENTRINYNPRFLIEFLRDLNPSLKMVHLFHSGSNGKSVDRSRIFLWISFLILCGEFACYFLLLAFLCLLYRLGILLFLRLEPKEKSKIILQRCWLKKNYFMKSFNSKQDHCLTERREQVYKMHITAFSFPYFVNRATV